MKSFIAGRRLPARTMVREWFLNGLLMALSLPAAAHAQNLVIENGRYTQTREKSFTVEPGGRLEMERVSGNISMKSWQQNRVTVRVRYRVDAASEADARRIIAKIEDRYVDGEDILRVDGRRGYHRFVDRDYTILIPRHFDVEIGTESGNITVEDVSGDIDLSSGGGEIHVAGIDGDVAANSAGGGLYFSRVTGAVEASTAGGEIEVEDVSDDVDLVTAGGGVIVRKVGRDVSVISAGGDIDITGVGGDLDAETAGGQLHVRAVKGEVDVTTAGGSVELRDLSGPVYAQTHGGDIWGRNLSGALELETSAGDINLEELHGSVDAATAVGSIDVDVTLAEFRRAHEIRLRTSNGDIRLSLPALLPATITASVHQRGRWDRNDIYSDFPLVRSGSDKRDNATVRSHGDINGGGDAIDVKTNGGSIHIRKKAN